MSWYPSADLENTRSSMSSPGHGFLSAPPTPVPSDHQLQDEFTQSTIPHGLPIAQGPSWEVHGPRGLGLLTLPVTTQPAYDAFATLPRQNPSIMPFSWPSEFCSSQAPVMNSRPLRKDSWSSESCDPLSTLLPGALWDHLRPTASSGTGCDTSPARSEYSTSSRPSAVSSPYTHSDICARRVDSPHLKIENLQDRTIPQIHFSNALGYYEQPMSVNPEDLMAQPQVPIEERVKTYLGSSSVSDTGDYKPPVDHSVHRRAHSSEDLGAGVLPHRPRRSYTRPDNANYRCNEPQCGKLFQRSYNLKAHMETHDPNRPKAHICQYDGCNKEFVRRTDLVRHERSVHLKARDHFCDLCGSSFPRKDTLTRHVEDGCPRRQKIGRRLPKGRRARVEQ